MDEHGAAAAARTAGNIGGDLLKRFTLTLDYGHQRLWLVPNALAAQPDVFDRSGLWIARAKDGTIAIADVAADSAAAKAGLTADDVIVAVDGTPASTIAQPAARPLQGGAGHDTGSDGQGQDRRAPRRPHPGGPGIGAGAASMSCMNTRSSQRSNLRPTSVSRPA